jgi:hypothetical protein
VEGSGDEKALGKRVKKMGMQGSYHRSRLHVVAGIVVELEHEDHNQVVVAFLVSSHGVDQSTRSSNQKKTKRRFGFK